MLSNEMFLVEKNEMLNYVGYNCEVVRKDSLVWENGVIIGVMSDKRSNVNMYRIKLNDGVIINKKKDNKLFKLGEKSDIVIKSRIQNYDNLSKDEILKKIKLLESEIDLLNDRLEKMGE
jgi:hypothetical protein